MHNRGGEIVESLSVNNNTPMCSGPELVEKFNGMLKTMLRRLCTEQPKQWHRYLNPRLFAYMQGGSAGVDRICTVCTPLRKDSKRTHENT